MVTFIHNHEVNPPIIIILDIGTMNQLHVSETFVAGLQPPVGFVHRRLSTTVSGIGYV
jgi:hypothetical protein